MSDLSEYTDKNLLEMLDFESQIFLDILHQDALVVTAKGLHIDVIFTNLLKVYCDPGNLIVVLNCSEYDEKYYIGQLNDEHVHTSSPNVLEREENYLKGGIHFITTRILVVDLLKKRIPIEKITGIFVLQAHTVLESCQEAFCLRLYRQHNKTGFIKAFSGNAETFTIGFGHVERIMRAIFVKELYIWPRFHVLVQQSLKKYEPSVIELQVPISQTMRNIQTCILDLMNITVNELKRTNKTIEMQEITVENCVAKKFHKILQAQLDCVWYQLNTKTKQLIADLKTLRYLIITMLYSDAITFYTVINQYRKMEYAQNSTWILHKSADQLFNYADNLVFTGDKELNPDYSPKWNILSEILQIEIPLETENQAKNIKPKILILCQDTKTCFQLNQYLSQGPQKYLFLMAMKKEVKFKKISKKFLKNVNADIFLREFNDSKVEESFDKPKKSKKEKKETKKDERPTDLNTLLEENLFADLDDDFENAKSFFMLTMSQINDKTKLGTQNESDEEEKCSGKEKDANETCYAFEPFAEMENMDLTNIENTNEPVIMIQTFKTDGNVLSLPKTLDEFQPNYIIMYHTNVTAIRQIEIYEARRRKETLMKVYFLIHAETVEEQSYLTALRREKEAFEHLIETKSRMVVPENQDGKSEDCMSLQRNMLSPVKNTRQGGKTDESDERKVVIVDMREFRSDLPALIHRRGIDIEPVTITIGDYILTPEICVERKSISDLIGSLNSGRLYQQCTQMTRHYTKPMLLIEFDQSRSFKFQGSYMLSNDPGGSGTFDIQKKLQLLTIHFPKLKIVWSPSPYASAQLFEELKEGKDQPSAQYAASLGADIDLDLIERKYNSGIYDFIQKFPGINSKNIDTFLRKTNNLCDVIKMSEAELKDVLGNVNDAKLFYSFLHEKHFQPEVEKSKSGKARPKFKFNKK